MDDDLKAPKAKAGQLPQADKGEPDRSRSSTGFEAAGELLPIVLKKLKP